MMRALRLSTLGLTALGLALAISSASAQEAKSTAAVRELVALLDTKLNDAQMAYIAAIDPADPGRFVGALYMKAAETLFVISGKFQQGSLDQRIAKREYQDAYIDLNSASTADTRLFFTDMKCDGLVQEPKGGAAADTLDGPGTRRVAFDGEPKKQKLSEQDYRTAFADADAQYEKAVRALITQASKPS
jgi:hypothetical protein